MPRRGRPCWCRTITCRSSAPGWPGSDRTSGPSISPTPRSATRSTCACCPTTWPRSSSAGWPPTGRAGSTRGAGRGPSRRAAPRCSGPHPRRSWRPWDRTSTACNRSPSRTPAPRPVASSTRWSATAAWCCGSIAWSCRRTSCAASRPSRSCCGAGPNGWAGWCSSRSPTRHGRDWPTTSPTDRRWRGWRPGSTPAGRRRIGRRSPSPSATTTRGRSRRSPATTCCWSTPCVTG